jgi:hypothetical protein
MVDNIVAELNSCALECRLNIIVQIRCDLCNPVQVGSDTMTTFNHNDIY